MKYLLMTMLVLLTFQAGGDGDPTRGQILAEDCADCHGRDGMGDPDIPPIAMLDEAYILEQLRAFKSGERISRDDMMLIYVEDLNEQEMADLAAYWSSLEDR